MENLQILKTVIKSKIDKEYSKQLTGYPSIDKPWLKYYTESQIKAEIPQMTCYEVLHYYNEEYGAFTAIDYFGRQIDYDSVFSKIEETAKAYTNIGVKAGDIVTICGVSTPELYYSFYALNKIGAIPNVIDPRTNASGIKRYLKEVDSKCLVTLDLCYPNVKDAIKDTNVTHVVVFSATDSLPFGLKLAKSTADKIKTFINKEIKIPNNKPYIKWHNFIKEGRKINDPQTRTYTPNYPAAIVHTGGTTGEPKAVLLSNENFNAAMVQVGNCPAKVERGDTFLNVIVPFVAFGTVLAMHCPMTLGWKSVVVPKFDLEELPSWIIKTKPNAMMGVPTYFEQVMNDKRMINRDLSHFNVVLGGGSPTLEEFEKRFNQFFKQHGSSATFSKGWSLTENSSVATCSFENANKPGSNGIPLSKTVISAFEPGTDKELPYNTEGELCITSPTMMLGYLNNEEATNAIKIKHSDGNYWIHTGDIGYIDEDGMVFVTDRIKRMIIRSGYKIAPSQLENLFLTHPAVENCAVVSIYDPVDKEVPKAHIVLKSEFLGEEEKMKEELNLMIENVGFPKYFTPVDYTFRESLPMTNIGKIDFISLQNEDKGKAYVKR